MKRCARIEDGSCTDVCPSDRTDCRFFRDADCVHSWRCVPAAYATCESDNCDGFAEPTQPEFRTDPTTGTTFPYTP